MRNLKILLRVAMSRRLLIDTNILLDVAIPEREESVYANLLMDELLYEDVEGYVPGTSLKDFYYIMCKYAGEIIARESVLSILDLCRIVPVSGPICRIAAESNEPDFEDGIVRACAESIPVDFIISRDKNAFGRSYIKCLTAQEYLDFFCDIEEIELPK